MSESSSTSQRKRKKHAPAAAHRAPEACEYPRLSTEVTAWEALTLSQEKKVSRAVQLLSGRFSPQAFNDAITLGALPGQRRAFGYYRREQFQSHPEDFFDAPAELPAVCLSHPHRLSRGEVIDLNFRSRYVPRYPAVREQFLSSAENQQVHAKLWRHPRGESLGTVIAIHGWLFGDSRLSAITMVPGFFYRLGLDVLIYELPYHGRRASGDRKAALFPSADVAITNEGFGQAIYDLRSLAGWVRQQSPGPIGAVGMSLGGYTAALWSSLDELDFVICAAPLVSLADLAWGILQEEERIVAIPAALKKYLSVELWRELFALHCPLSYVPQTKLDRRMIIAGTADPVIPESQPTQLWEHWDRPEIKWLSGDHLGQIAHPAALQAMHSFLSARGLAYEDILRVT